MFVKQRMPMSLPSTPPPTPTRPRYVWRWSALYSPRGILAGIGLLLGLGRLTGYGLSASLSFGVSEVYAAALLLGGLALLLSLPGRLTIMGRACASFAAACFAFMTAGTWGNNASNLYLFCALLCVWEAITRRPYDC
jgi:hypothetical protein